MKVTGAVMSPEWEPERPADHPGVVLPGGGVTGGLQGPAQQLLQPRLQLELELLRTLIRAD